MVCPHLREILYEDEKKSVHNDVTTERQKFSILIIRDSGRICIETQTL